MAPLAMALNLGYANAPASMVGAEAQQAEGTVVALGVAMVPGQDALGVVDMAMPKASLIEVNQQLGLEVGPARLQSSFARTGHIGRLGVFF